MTTARFNRMASYTAQALNKIKRQHCQPPAYKPPQDVRGQMGCTRCPGTLKYTVRASDGLCSGRCTTTGCLNWSDQ